MKIYYECSFSKLIVEDKVKEKNSGVIYGVASTWIELSRVLYKVMKHRQRRLVVLFVSDELLSSCDFFSKLAQYGFICARVNSLLDKEFSLTSEQENKISKRFPLNRNDIKFIQLYEKGMNVETMCNELGVNVKIIYNQKSALLKRIGLPNEHVLILLLPVITLIINMFYQRNLTIE